MIRIEHVTKSFGHHTVLDDVGFHVEAGQIVGFLGPNGAGKSTCLKILTGLVRPDRGRATVTGVGYHELPNPGAIVGTLIAVDSFHPGRSGREALCLAALTLGTARTRIDQILEEVGLSEAESRRKVREYSTGMKQRLGVAQALLGDPQVLVLDEPTNGLDPQGQRWLDALLRHRTEQGCAVLLSSHQLVEVARLADRAVVIGGGRILMDQPIEEASASDLEERYFQLTGGADRAA